MGESQQLWSKVWESVPRQSDIYEDESHSYVPIIARERDHEAGSTEQMTDPIAESCRHYRKEVSVFDYHSFIVAPNRVRCKTDVPCRNSISFQLFSLSGRIFSSQFSLSDHRPTFVLVSLFLVCLPGNIPSIVLGGMS